MTVDRTRTWLLAPGEAALRRRSMDLLVAEGLDVSEKPDSDEPAVLIARVEECLADRVAEMSSSGRRRLVVITVGAPPSSPWDLLAAGASDVLDWGTDGIAAMRAVAARIRRWFQIDRLAAAGPVATRLVGESPAWRSTLRWLVEIARYSDASVLLTGESGTGKELAARLIHALDPRRGKGRFVIVDCTTIMATLAGPELFGHERGAFTGAHTARKGAFSEADGGVLFLDEIGELPLALQPGLLRVLQERSFKPLGSQRWTPTDFRLVCATNRDLPSLEQDGHFRRDLRFRLSAATVRLPSLAERVEDIPLLANHFLSELLSSPAPELDPAVENFLVSRDYPGNVRELRQLITQMTIRHVGGPVITAGTIPDGERTTRSRPGPAGLAESVRLALRDGLDLRTLKSTVADLAVDTALSETRGNVAQAAKRLGVTTRALQLRRAGGDGVAVAE